MAACSRCEPLGFDLLGDLFGMVGAGVPGRGEYLNEYAPAKPTSSTMRSVAGNRLRSRPESRR